MNTFPKPKLGFFLRVLLDLAYAISAKKDKEWLEAMHFELGFIPSWQERFHVVSSALLLALRWRFASFRKLNRPQMLSLASASIAALVVLVVFLPQFPTHQKAAKTTSATVLPTEPSPAAEPPPAPASPITGDLADSTESDMAMAEETESNKPLDPAPALAQAERSVSPQPGLVGAADAGAAQESYADTTRMVPGDELGKAQLNLSDDSQVVLKARAAIRVTVFKDAAPIYDQTLDPEESFSFEPPAVLESPDFAQLELFQNGQPLALPSEVNRLELSLDPP
ncbi:MAG: hypothetical protein KC422_02345 [Trueperaceae bacterium]|nr:hypothetical protein [Trueperaceae bacterium]